MKLREFHDKAYFDHADGVYRWESNGFIPLEDGLREAGVSDEIIARCNEKREEETNAKLIECLNAFRQVAKRGVK